jgi:hypothetical protein
LADQEVGQISEILDFLEISDGCGDVYGKANYILLPIARYCGAL